MMNAESGLPVEEDDWERRIVLSSSYLVEQ